MQTYLKATLKNGIVVIGEFAKIGTGGRYAAQVFGQMKPFNAWRVVATQHPASGEACVVRTRVMYNGDSIATIQAVVPVAGAEATHNFDPIAFEPKVEIQQGENGLWTAPEDGSVIGAVAGMAYPLHRDPTTLVRYVVLRAEADGLPALVHSLDEAPRPVDEEGDGEITHPSFDGGEED